MICVNFFGGAGIGKSTIAAAVYAKLKQKGYRTELVGEYAKELCYEDSMKVIKDQLYLFAEQEHRLRCLKESGVEVAICDSPTPLSIAYDRDNDQKLAELIWDRVQRYDNMNFVMQRDESYFTEDDRIDTMDTAKSMDKKIRMMLAVNNVPYTEIHPDDAEAVLKELSVKRKD